MLMLSPIEQTSNGTQSFFSSIHCSEGFLGFQTRALTQSQSLTPDATGADGATSVRRRLVLDCVPDPIQ